MIFRAQCFCSLLCIAAVVTVSSQPVGAQNVASTPLKTPVSGNWYVMTVSGTKILPQTLNVTENGWLLHRGDDVTRLVAADVFSVMNTAPNRPEVPARISLSRLLLSNGDRLLGQLTALSEAGLELQPLIVSSAPGAATPGSNEAETANPTVVKIPIESVRALEWIPPGTQLGAETPLPKETEVNSDALLLSNGDQLSGELTTISSDSLTFRDDQGSRTIPTSEVRAILFNPELLLAPPAPTEYSRVALSDGSLLTLTDLKLVNYNRFEMQTVLAGSYQIPLDKLVTCSSFSKTLVPLSGRIPSSVNSTPFLSLTPRWQVDRNARNAPLQMAGGRYLTGIGVHSRTALTWPIEDGDLRFIADIGIDDSTQGGGSVMFTVLVDDEVAFESGAVRGGELPRTIDIDLKGKKSLTLLVDFGEGGDVLDRADWGHAVILREDGFE